MIEDTADLFENDDEKKQVIDNISNIFKTNKREAKKTYMMYGMKPEVFKCSLLNPNRCMNHDKKQEEEFTINFAWIERGDQGTDRAAGGKDAGPDPEASQCAGSHSQAQQR